MLDIDPFDRVPYLTDNLLTMTLHLRVGLFSPTALFLLGFHPGPSELLLELPIPAVLVDPGLHPKAEHLVVCLGPKPVGLGLRFEQDAPGFVVRPPGHLERGVVSGS